MFPLAGSGGVSVPGRRRFGSAPGNGAFRLRLRYRCTPRMESHENVKPMPAGIAFSREIDEFTEYGVERSADRTRIEGGVVDGVAFARRTAASVELGFRITIWICLVPSRRIRSSAVFRSKR